MTGALVLLILLAVFEFVAFAGFRLAIQVEGHRGLQRVAILIYWLASLSVLVAFIGFAFFGPRNVDNEPRIPGGIVIAAVAVYLPKIGLAVLTLFDFARQALGWILRRAILCGGAQSGWLTRTRFLPRVGLGFAVLIFCTIIWGATLGRTDVRMYRHTLLCASLPASFDGLRIAHISDIHAPSLGASAGPLADHMIAAVNSERPDLIVFTGDYGEPADFARDPAILGKLRARLGKFAVLGNHDFGPRERASDNWASADDKRRKIEALARVFGSQGFILLMNDGILLSKGSDRIAILGVGVYDPHHGFDDADLDAAERAAGNAAFSLLLAHSPQYWEKVVQSRSAINLTLVGHTHGAQVGFGVGSFAWSPAALAYRHWGGLYRDGRQYLNVNRGAGYVGLPLRINMPADISVIVLRSSPAGTAS